MSSASLKGPALLQRSRSGRTAQDALGLDTVPSTMMVNPDRSAGMLTTYSVGGLPRSLQRKLSAEFGLVVISDPVKERIRNVEVEEALHHIQAGATLLKYCSGRFKSPHERHFYVDLDLMIIRWLSPNKTVTESQIYFSDIARIVPGTDSDFWRLRSDKERSDLGIEILAGVRKLRVACKDEIEWKLWFTGLLYAQQRSITSLQGEGSLSSSFIRKQWDLTDRNRDGKVQFDEVLILLKRLNCNTDIGYASELFKSAVAARDKDADGLTFDEFKIMLQRLLTHVDVMSYFEHYIKADVGRDRVMSIESYIEFLHEVQGADQAEIDHALRIVRTLSGPFAAQDESYITDLGFNALITGESNSIFDPQKQRKYQDMTRPITDYYIASSHNTYLTSDQVVGRSAVGQYIEVLLTGCRCVELDCWDGPDGEPVIFHGYTLTSKIPFEAVVKACRDYGFKRNPYPIILSLEMHCSARQKARIGDILHEVLGNSLHVLTELDKHQPPSPESLKYRFLVKGKVLGEGDVEEEEEGNEDDLQAEETEIRQQLLNEFPQAFCVNIELPNLVLPVRGLGDIIGQSNRERSGDRETSGSDARRGPSSTRSADDLSHYYEAICLPGKKLKSFDDRSRHAMHVCTFNERRLMRLYKLEAPQLVKFHHSFLSRIYPAGTRVMSSNYNPIFCWSVGCQMVALNYQAVGMALLLNVGRFNENGNMGYVLKPPILSDSTISSFDPHKLDSSVLTRAGEEPCVLTMQILAGQQLPRLKVRDDDGRKRDTACPSVTVSVQGVPFDTTTKKTTSVSNNGLNPRWNNQVLDFVVAVPSLAIMVFEVRHSDNARSEYLAGNAIPVNCIRPGLRWVPLYDAHGRYVRWSGLIVHVKKTSTVLEESRFEQSS